MFGNFVYAHPTKIYFGDAAERHLSEAIRPF